LASHHRLIWRADQDFVHFDAEAQPTVSFNYVPKDMYFHVVSVSQADALRTFLRGQHAASLLCGPTKTRCMSDRAARTKPDETGTRRVGANTSAPPNIDSPSAEVMQASNSYRGEGTLDSGLARRSLSSPGIMCIALNLGIVSSLASTGGPFS
jgi:hypothetical protein